jgi:hypothetical protein
LFIPTAGAAKTVSWPVTVVGVLSSAPKNAARKSRFCQRGAASSHFGAV